MRQNVLRLACLYGMAAVFLGAGASKTPAGIYDDWGYRATISFPGYAKDEALVDFPALVILSPRTMIFLPRIVSAPPSGAEVP